MTATFEMTTDELNPQFFKSLKTLFGKKQLTISVSDNDSEFLPDDFLKNQIDKIENGNGEFISFSMEEFQKMSESMLAK